MERRIGDPPIIQTKDQTSVDLRYVRLSENWKRLDELIGGAEDLENPSEIASEFVQWDLESSLLEEENCRYLGSHPEFRSMATRYSSDILEPIISLDQKALRDAIIGNYENVREIIRQQADHHRYMAINAIHNSEQIRTRELIRAFKFDRLVDQMKNESSDAFFNPNPDATKSFELLTANRGGEEAI